MSGHDWFQDLPEEFEESVRIDRADEGKTDHRRDAIDSYHVTVDSRQFISEFVDRLVGESTDMRAGSNYWLYGYYGSGKSHLLTVLDGLMDSEWLDGKRDEVWSALQPDTVGDGDDVATLRHRWERAHDENQVIPVSINLLKYQGQKQRSFSEIILRHAHQNGFLTGVDDGISDGLSSQLDVAYFEKWYRTTDSWDDRQARATSIVEGVTPPNPRYDWCDDAVWKDIQQYGALADVVLPELFEQETGTRDGYGDLLPDDIDPKEVVSRLEELRTEREAEVGRPVKLVLLLDEVSLFIGTDFGRLTELQTIAENVDEIGDGEIQLVVTAQAKIEEVQPKFAAKGADFTILKDRFPHRYQLPSKHVGDIAKRRLFEKSTEGEHAVERILADASVRPAESLVYNEVRQNTQPPLDSIDDEELRAFYPFLPYHAPLFLTILFNLRKEASDPAKSIFSGTARAILALMHSLLTESWLEEKGEDQIISLVDFYDLIEPELRDILGQDMRVIEGNETVDGIEDAVDDGELTAFDLKVAKAILLLQNVHDVVPMNEGNLAVAVMDDLNGQPWISTSNRVEESLKRMQKFIRPTDGENEPRYRFATQEERLIYETTETNETAPEWGAILEALDDHLWQRIVQELSLPDSSPYGDSGDEYPISYRFGVDGVDFETTVERAGGLEVDVEIRGLRSDVDSGSADASTLYWTVDSEGLDDLRGRLEEWWALRAAVDSRDAPEPVMRDLGNRADRVVRKLVSALDDGSYQVKDQSTFEGLDEAVQTAVENGYPDDFHPMMLQVDDDRLNELETLGRDDPLPDWAQKIQVPVPGDLGDSGQQAIQNHVLALTGRQLKGEDIGLNIQTVLDGIVETKPYYDDVRPALRALLWGFCRRERFLPIDEDGNTLQNEAVLDSTRSATTRLKLLEVENIGDLLEEHEFKQTTETVAEGLINLQEANQRLRSQLASLQEDIQLVVDTDVRTGAVAGLLAALRDALETRIGEADDRLDDVRAQDDLATAIPETRRQLEWFEAASEIWERRRSNIYHWDAALTLGEEASGWTSETTQATVQSQRDSLAAYDGAWWSTEGWGTLVDTVSADLAGALQADWESFETAHDVETLVARIDAHDWVRPAMDLPSQVGRGFERASIAPLRQFLRWHTTVDEAITTLSGDGDAALEAAGEVADLDPPSSVVDGEIESLSAQLERLTDMVADRTPETVGRIGVVPDDRESLDTHLLQLVEQGEIDIEETETGVVIR
jgi:hypothetical protein